MSTASILDWLFANSTNLAWYDEDSDEYKRFEQTPIWEELVFQSSYHTFDDTTQLSLGIICDPQGVYDHERDDC